MTTTCDVLLKKIMMTSSNGNIFRVTCLYAGNSPVTSEFSAQRWVTRSFDVFFDLRLNKRLSKQSEARDLRRHRAHYDVIVMSKTYVFQLYDDVMTWTHFTHHFTLCVGNLPVTDRFPAQKASHANFDIFPNCFGWHLCLICPHCEYVSLMSMHRFTLM